ncbi:cytochrome P450 [Lentithecium fluviatile CBS 122367]|uniref:Cytochrome P450 n=1 Tax=Lentithecium fluviatile CBS 122367 TaxID=1168545 RepID=A0A6G1IRP7_9PLEO|nr:cytochrome P450 [Lentithecium fluviatile CBS 122367]
MTRKKVQYYITLRDQSNLPIYTLRLPGSRIYVVNSPSLISAVQRQYKALSLWPIAAKASVQIARFSKTASDIINTNTNGEDGDRGCVITFHDAIQPSLAPGKHLDAMNRVMLGLVAVSLNRLEQQATTKVKLFDWITQQITFVTTNSAYGPANPYKDPAAVAAFGTYTYGISSLILGLPFTPAGRASIQAMAFGSTAFETYFRDDHHRKGSALVQARYDHSMEHHIPLNDIARAEFANGIALLSNTVPNTGWMLYHIYSDPIVLADCRRELTSVVTMTNGPEGKPTHTVDVSKVKTSCPIFLSTYKEVLRTYSNAVSARRVMEDHMLDNQYLLKKGSTVLMPSPVQHHNPGIWGPAHDAFDHRRFTKSEKRINPTGFRTFGGGNTLCPGRHFATTEILAFTAAMILQFDVKPASGSWKRGLKRRAEFWESTLNPDEDFEVEVRPVEGEGVKKEWAFTLSDLDAPIALSAEDIPEEGH